MCFAELFHQVWLIVHWRSPRSSREKALRSLRTNFSLIEIAALSRAAASPSHLKEPLIIDEHTHHRNLFGSSPIVDYKQTSAYIVTHFESFSLHIATVLP